MDTIAKSTKLSQDGVEFLLMKTLSLHLIEGSIDQVSGTVQVYSAHPVCTMNEPWHSFMASRSLMTPGAVCPASI